MTDTLLTIWRPGHGISPEAISRMRSHGKMPRKPMGEAWFMSKERKFYPELADRETLLKLSPIELVEILSEISSGTSMGPREEWDGWFKFLLPDLICRAHEDQYFNTYVLQPVVTAFMAIFWDGITEHYPGFRQDIFASLFQVLMDERLWDERGRPIFLTEYENGVGDPVLGWNQGESDGNVAAMIMCGLKYLRPDEIGKWIESILAIDDIHWRGNFLVWLMGAYDLLRSGSLNPAKFDRFTPHISWEQSSLLDSEGRTSDTNERPFVSETNINVFIEEIDNCITYELLTDWAASFDADYLVAMSTNGVPDALLNKMRAYKEH